MELVIVRNPDAASTLPYLMHLPVGGGLLFRTKNVFEIRRRGSQILGPAGVILRCDAFPFVAAWV